MNFYFLWNRFHVKSECQKNSEFSAPWVWNSNNSEFEFSLGPDGRVAVSSAQASEENAQIFVMNNYFGIGADAELCYAFHTARERKPHKFNSRLHNKGVYFKVGLQKMVDRSFNKDLSKEIHLEVDGRPVDLPSIKGIIILNIMRCLLVLK